MRQLLLLTFVTLLISVAMNNEANSSITQPSLSVSTSASIEVLPDYINLTIEVKKTKPTMFKAKESVDVTTGKILSSLQKLGLSPENIEASEITAQPKYNWTKNERVFIGEQVKRIVRVKLYQKDKYTDIISSITKLDVSRYYQQGFGYDNIDEHRNKALGLAIKKAKEKATLIAEGFNKQVIDVYQIVEKNNTTMPSPLRMMAMSADSNASEKNTAPLEIKPQEIEASISVVFLIK